MPSGRLGHGSRMSQFYQASGESTPETKLPEKFISTPAATSPISGHLTTPSDFKSLMPGGHDAVVRRWPRMVGMRYLYARGMTRMPVHPLGADGTPIPWTSSYQPNSHGPTHDAGFNDALFQAGYPGFNLGLSFKVPTVQRNLTGGPGANMRSTGPVAVNVQSLAVNRLTRPSGAPKERRS